MLRFLSLALLATAGAAERAAAADEPLVAFPGAEGHGRFAAGGRGGAVAIVDTLADAGPGSLREALQGPHRTVVFAVSGTIDLESELVIRHPQITIAGQTAPGGGIALKRFPLRVEGTHDIIVRHLRVRPGDESGQPVDGIEIRDSQRVIIDHCSVSWSIDEGINSWHGARELTVQWCLISEPLNRSVHYAPHAYGATWGGRDTSYHHNLLAHCTARNPSIGGNHERRTIRMDHRCSVIYNWQHRTCDGKPDSINVVNNYYKPGPATRPAVRRRIARVDETLSKYGFQPKWYIAGNVVEGAPELTEDNWAGGVDYEAPTVSEAISRRLEPFPFAPVTTESATEAYRRVVEDAGATRPLRDAHDRRILHEVTTGTATFGNGIIDSQTEVGGWPALESRPAPIDTDRDGMPDEWERQRGLNPKEPGDRNLRAADGYTHLEHYLAELAR